MDWLCYIIRSDNRTYVGVTNNLQRRLRQHNGEIKGGAKATRGRAWTLVCTVHGFPTVTAVLQFEWRMHHPPLKGSGLQKRLQNLDAVLAMRKWTRTAPLTSSCQLRVEWKTEKPIAAAKPTPATSIPKASPTLQPETDFVIV